MARTKSEKVKNAKQERNAEATQAVILAAAEEEFAQHGFTAARTEAIAAKTGVAKSMIYYYFKDKEGLYQAVLERSHSDLFANDSGVTVGGFVTGSRVGKIFESIARLCIA